MVMTERSAPRMSVLGGAMAFCLAGAAWLATPLWACPPESADKVECEVQARGQSPRAAVVAPKMRSVSPATSRSSSSF